MREFGSMRGEDIRKKVVVKGLELNLQNLNQNYDLPFYPILLDRHGNVIDGQHRLTAGENWPKIRLEHVEAEEQPT